jgi:hypothetical protein
VAEDAKLGGLDLGAADGHAWQRRNRIEMPSTTITFLIAIVGVRMAGGRLCDPPYTARPLLGPSV